MKFEIGDMELNSFPDEENKPIDAAKFEQDIIDSEQYLIDMYFDRNEFNKFCQNNKVEVIMSSDYQYHCYINYNLGDGSWYTSIRNPLTAMVMGIKRYKDKQNENLGEN